MTEEKIIDMIIDCIDLLSAYVPTTVAPANPQLPVIRAKLVQLRAIREKSKASFKLYFDDLVTVNSKITEIQLNAND